MPSTLKPEARMEGPLSRRDFLKLAGALSLSMAAPGLGTSYRGFQSLNAGQNVIILVFDALSANHIGLHGYARDTMPNLSRWAERAVVYHNHYAGGNFTTPGTASILTGTMPWTHRALDLYGTIATPFVQKNIFSAFPDHYRLAYTHNPVANTLLKQVSTQMDEYVPLGTLLLTNDEVITTLFGRDESTASVSWTRAMKSQEEGYAYSLFMARVVTALRERRIASLRSQFPVGLPHIAGDNYFLLEDAIDWLGEKVQSVPEPFMGYFHFMPPHGPYTTRVDYFGHFAGDGYWPPYKRRDLFADEEGNGFEQLQRKRLSYDEFILYVDSEFGRLMDRLESSGLLANTWVVLTSDHGEMFERGIAGHLTPVLYEPVIRVPLLIFEPGRTDREDIHANTSVVDLLPTLLQVTGQEQAAWSEGGVLPPFSNSYESRESVYVLQARKSGAGEPLTEATVAQIKGQHKLMYFFGYKQLGSGDERLELYDIESDPEELNDLASSKRGTAAEMLEEIKSKLTEVNRPYL